MRRFPAPRLPASSAPLAVALIALALGALLVGAALAGPSPRAEAGARLHAEGSATPGRDRLSSFDSCDQLRGYAGRHREALRFDSAPALEEDLAVPGAAGDAAAPTAAQSASSSTNVQEDGVDEPDLAKSDGSFIFSISGARLEAVRITAPDGSGPEAVGSLRLPDGPGKGGYSGDHQLLLAGDRALVISSAAMSRSPWTRTILTEVDLTHPAAMRAVRTLTVEGFFVSARQSGATARVVTSTTPSYPLAGRGFAAGGPGTISAASGVMPVARLRDRETGTVTRSPLMACRDVRKPARFSGLELLSVLTIDLEQGLDPVDSDAVISGGQVVYASSQSLYIATERWLEPERARARGFEVTTAIHKFDVTDPARTEYVGTGRVPGYMLSQWSMSEHEGLLRVASTLAPPWTGGGTEAESESLITVLGERSGRLVEVGRVGGLGEGERIYAVRFIGELGYVVTFREVDPLYTLDLSDPARPRVVGELKVPGYSAYLHPASAGTLLGVGQDVSDDGLTRGAQVSLFDLTDLSAPARIDLQSLGSGSYTEVEYDHHAFLYSEPEQLAVVPVEIYGEARRHFSGAVAMRIDPDSGIEHLRRLSHGDAWGAAIRRSMVIGERLFTISGRGVMAHDLGTLEATGWAGFGR